MWSLEFDGSCAKVGLGAWVVLTFPSGETTFLSYKLDFNNTNKMTEYEDLFLGIATTKQKGAKIPNVQGDAKLVVEWVKSICNKEPKIDKLS